MRASKALGVHPSHTRLNLLRSSRLSFSMSSASERGCDSGMGGKIAHDAKLCLTAGFQYVRLPWIPGSGNSLSPGEGRSPPGTPIFALEFELYAGDSRSRPISGDSEKQFFPGCTEPIFLLDKRSVVHDIGRLFRTRKTNPRRKN